MDEYLEYRRFVLWTRACGLMSCVFFSCGFLLLIFFSACGNNNISDACQIHADATTIILNEMGFLSLLFPF